MRTFCSLVVLTGFLGLPMYADVAAFTAPSGLSTATFAPGGSECCNLGMVFTPSTNMTVDALGLYDIPGEIPAAGNTIALYDSSGSLLTQTVVLPTDSVVDGYYYQSVSDIALSAGQQYTVNEFGTSGEWAYGGAPTTAAGITYDFHAYSFATTLTFPTSTAGAAGNAYYGPNVFFSSVTTVPEPNALPFIGIVLAGLLLLSKKKATAS